METQTILRAIRNVAIAAGFFSLFIAVMVAMYFMTAWFYRVIGHTPPPYLAQLINTMLGLVLYGALVNSLTLWGAARGRSRHRQMGAFEPIFAAMEQIAKGNFQVSLNSAYRTNLFASELVRSLNQMAAKLGEMEQLRQDFIANVSHEIQSPLTSIRGFVQLLHDDSASAADRQHYLSIIEAETGKLSSLSDSMLKLSALEAEDIRAERRHYRLDRQLRTVIVACEPQWIGKSLDMEADLEELDVLASEDLLSQVWSNLLHNSIKFTPAGGHVCVRARRAGNIIECRVTDTGIGVPKEAQLHVFERFYKVDQSRSNAGSGLGLAIAKRIVELHQGRIAIESEPGRGTSIVVSLPQQP